MQIDKLIVFKAKTKAVADDVNSNFEQLRVSNNEQHEFLETLQKNFNEYIENPCKIIECNSNILEFDSTTNNFKVSGTSDIQSITGINNGFVFIELRHQDY